METMNVAIPESMKAFVQQEVAKGGYSSVSEYVRSLIRVDQERRVQERLEAEILQGLESGQSTPMTPEDWAEIRCTVRERYKQRQTSEG